jgi:hypothetical protein
MIIRDSRTSPVVADATVYVPYSLLEQCVARGTESRNHRNQGDGTISPFWGSIYASNSGWIDSILADQSRFCVHRALTSFLDVLFVAIGVSNNEQIRRKAALRDQCNFI